MLLCVGAVGAVAAARSLRFSQCLFVCTRFSVCLCGSVLGFLAGSPVSFVCLVLFKAEDYDTMP